MATMGYLPTVFVHTRATEADFATSKILNSRWRKKQIRSYKVCHLFTGGVWFWDPVSRYTKGVLYGTGPKAWEPRLRKMGYVVYSLNHYSEMRTNPLLLGILMVQADALDAAVHLDAITPRLEAARVMTGRHNYANWERKLDTAGVDLAELSADVSGEAIGLGALIAQLQGVKRSLDFLLEESQSLQENDFDSIPNKAFLCSMLNSKKPITAARRTLERQVDVRLDDARRLQKDSEMLLQTIFTLISQQDQELSIQIARDSRTLAEQTTRDSTSMKAIAAVTMFFLTGTFVAVSLNPTSDANVELTKIGCACNAYVLVPCRSWSSREQKLLAILGHNPTSDLQCGMRLAGLGQSTGPAKTPGKAEDQKRKAKGPR